jgi:hypothetical protein
MLKFLTIITTPFILSAGFSSQAWKSIGYNKEILFDQVEGDVLS